MTIIPVYIYEGVGGTIQTPIKLPLEETKQLARLIADEGKILVNGDQETTCIDVELQDIEYWQEVDAKEEKEE